MNEDEAKVESSEGTETAPLSTPTVSIEALATKLNTTPKRLRGFLREFFPRDETKSRWQIPPALSRKIERKYKTEILDPRAKKQAKVEKELEGQA